MEFWPSLEPIVGTIAAAKLRGHPRARPDKVLTAVLYIVLNELPWGAIPQNYPKVKTCSGWFLRWMDDGALLKAGLILGFETELREALTTRGHSAH